MHLRQPKVRPAWRDAPFAGLPSYCQLFRYLPFLRSIGPNQDSVRAAGLVRILNVLRAAKEGETMTS